MNITRKKDIFLYFFLLCIFCIAFIGCGTEKEQGLNETDSNQTQEESDTRELGDEGKEAANAEEGITDIGRNAFANCTELRTVYLAESVDIWEKVPFGRAYHSKI